MLVCAFAGLLLLFFVSLGEKFIANSLWLRMRDTNYLLVERFVLAVLNTLASSMR